MVRVREGCHPCNVTKTISCKAGFYTAAWALRMALKKKLGIQRPMSNSGDSVIIWFLVRHEAALYLRHLHVLGLLPGHHLRRHQCLEKRGPQGTARGIDVAFATGRRSYLEVRQSYIEVVLTVSQSSKAKSLRCASTIEPGIAWLIW